MVGVAHRDHADAVTPGTRDRVEHRIARDDLPDALAAIDHRDRAGVDDARRAGHGLHDAFTHPLEIPRRAQHAMRRVPPQVGPHQGVRDKGGVRIGKPDRAV